MHRGGLQARRPAIGTDWHDVPCATCAYALWTREEVSEDGYLTVYRQCLHPLMSLGVAKRPITACDEQRSIGLHPVLEGVQKNQIVTIMFDAEDDGDEEAED